MKRAINTRAVELLPLAEARRLIEDGARQAVAAAKKPAPVRTGPYKVTMRFRDVTIPEVASAFREMERSRARRRRRSPATRCPTPTA